MPDLLLQKHFKRQTTSKDLKMILIVILLILALLVALVVSVHMILPVMLVILIMAFCFSGFAMRD